MLIIFFNYELDNNFLIKYLSVIQKKIPRLYFDYFFFYFKQEPLTLVNILSKKSLKFVNSNLTFSLTFLLMVLYYFSIFLFPTNSKRV